MDGPRETVVFLFWICKERTANQQVEKEEVTVRIYRFLGYYGRSYHLIYYLC
ncbi:hypothetical protein gpAD87_02270 [Paenibacillus sp. AD87]|nr:hypothetical protein gpAD87_02270 [Paenibacillus sp. AD87]